MTIYSGLDYLKSSGTPVDELNRPFGLDGSDSRVNVLGHDVAAIQHATGHVFTVTGITFHHLIGRLETGLWGNLIGHVFTG